MMKASNTLIATVSCLAIFMSTVCSPVQAAEPAGKSDSLQWIGKFLADVDAYYQRANAPKRAAVEFVVDNDVWLPGNRYTNGPNWLALSCKNAICTLEPATLTVKKQSWQGLYDDQPTLGRNLHFSLQSGNDTKVLAWFQTSKSSPWLKPTNVPTYFGGGKARPVVGQGTLESAIDLPDGRMATLVPLILNKNILCQARKLSPDSCMEGGRLLLQLRDAGKRQMLLGDFGECSGTVSPGYLVWAGDIDGDGKPDYIVSFVDGSGPVHLYLSSKAKPGDLVGLAGVYESPPIGYECDGPQNWFGN